MRQKLYLIILLAGAFSFLGFSANAQDCSGLVQETEYLYNIGRFNEGISGVNNCLAQKDLSYDLRVQAYRLLAMCYLASDSVNEADASITQLLSLKDDFTADARDPERFRSELMKIQASLHTTLVSSVSKKAEDIRRAPATVNVITQEEIIQRGYTDLVQLLGDLPGFDISIAYNSNYANIYQRGLRTNTTEKTLLLIDGVEENDLWTNTADLSRQYPITNIKRVEVIYGPASTMYGPNAFMGTINIITKSASDLTGANKSFGVHANAGYGSYQSRYGDITIGYKKNLFSAVVSGRYYESDQVDLSSQTAFDYDASAYDNVDYAKLMNIKTNAQTYVTNNKLTTTNPNYTIYSSGGKADSVILTPAGVAAARNADKAAYKQVVNGQTVGYGNMAKSYLVNGKISFGDFTIGGEYMYKKEGAGALSGDLIADMNNTFWIPRRSFIYARYERKLSEKLQLTSLSTYRNHGIDDETRQTLLSNYARGTLTLKDLNKDSAASWNTTYYYQTNKQFRTELKALYTPFQNLYIVGGIEYRNSQLQGNYLTSTNVEVPEENGTFSTDQLKGGNQFNINDLGIYAQGNYRFLKYFGVTAGARIDNNSIRKTGGFGTEVSPRLVADFAKNDWVIKAIYSRGIMNVSNFTKFSTTATRIANPDLATESIRNYEASVSKRINKNFTIDADFYHAYIMDIVGVGPTANGLTQNQNLGQYKIDGIQANLVYTHRNLTINANYTYTDPRQTRSDNGGTDTSLRVADIAENHINLIVNYLLLKRININLRNNFVGSKPTGVGTTVPANTTQFSAYFISNLTLGVLVVKGTTLQFVCNNLFDKYYMSPGVRLADGVSNPVSYLQPGRNYYIKINYEF